MYALPSKLPLPNINNNKQVTINLLRFQSLVGIIAVVTHFYVVHSYIIIIIGVPYMN